MPFSRSAISDAVAATVVASSVPAPSHRCRVTPVFRSLPPPSLSPVVTRESYAIAGCVGVEHTAAFHLLRNVSCAVIAGGRGIDIMLLGSRRPVMSNAWAGREGDNVVPYQFFEERKVRASVKEKRKKT